MTNKINGIDVSEEIRYCNNCSNLGLDFKTGKFYCGLSNRKDELPEILSCENFSSNCYIKRLQEDNEKLKEKIKSEKYIKENALQEATKYCMKCGEFRQALEEIRKEANRLLYKENPIYGYNNSNYFELYAKYVLAKIKEALNDRD